MRKFHFRSLSVDILETLLDNYAVRGFLFPLPGLLYFPGSQGYQHPKLTAGTSPRASGTAPLTSMGEIS